MRLKYGAAGSGSLHSKNINNTAGFLAMAAYTGAGAVNLPLNPSMDVGPVSVGTKANAFSPFFGEPRRELRLNPYSAYGRENNTLPDAYNGPNDYLLNIMITMIKDEDMWPTRVVLPIRVTEDEMEIRWDEITFNDTMATPVPEEGVSRLLTQTTNERRDYYQRSGVALLLEHGFMKTEKGRMTYQMNLMQIRNAVLEMMYFGVIEALLRSKEYSQAWTRQYGQMVRSGSSLRGYLGDEVDRYMALQKSEHAFDMLDHRAKKFLKRSGIVPDTWVLPEGTSSYLKLVRPENRDYLLAGPGGPASYKALVEARPTAAAQTLSINSCAVYESKSFAIPGAQAPVDPLVRERSVGEYYVMQDTVSSLIHPSEYRTAMRNIWVFNERIDGWSELKIGQMLKACCRFEPGTGALTFPASSGRLKDDPFLMPGRVPVGVFGDMEAKYMSDSTILHVAESIYGKFLDSLDLHASERSAYLKSIGPARDTSTEPITKHNFANFFRFVKQHLPESRLFKAKYCPKWLKNTIQNHFEAESNEEKEEQSSFFFTALAKKVPQREDVNNKVLVEILPALKNEEIAEADLAGTLNLDFGVKVVLDSMKIDWNVVRTELSKVLSTDVDGKPSEDISDANTQFIDVFVARLMSITNCYEPQTNRLLNLTVASYICKLMNSFKQFKERAKTAPRPWVRHAVFVMHAAINELANYDAELFNRGNEQGLIPFVNAKLGQPGIDWTVNDHDQVQQLLWGNLWDAQAKRLTIQLVFPTDAAAAAKEVPHVLVGAFTVPQLNAQLGAMPRGGKHGRDHHHDDEDEMERYGSRFGVEHTRATKYHPSEPAEEMPDGYNDHMLARFAEIKAGGYPELVKAIMLTFLHTPVTEGTLEKLLEKDVYFPFNFLVFRPSITHLMATGVLLKAGSETGETLIGHADFQLADDVVRKMHYGNFTIYSKSIIRQNDNVYLAEDIVSTGYVGGNDVGINTIKSLRGEGGEQEAERSIFAALVPVMGDEPGEEGISAGATYPNPMDITGKFANHIPHLQNLDREIGNGAGLPHYPGADFYALAWRKNNGAQAFERGFVYAQSNRNNTLCFQGHQNNYNPADKTYNAAVTNTGHFGPRVYPGCGQVRRMSSMKYLVPVSYTTSFGGQMNMTSVGV